MSNHMKICEGRMIPRSRHYRVAVMMLKRGHPLPVDLQFHLLADGYDVAAMERRYSV